MCQATVYLVQNGQEKEIMRDVILLEPVEGGIRLQAFFEDPVTLQARVGCIDFLKHTVTLVPMEVDNMATTSEHRQGRRPVGPQDKLRVLLPHWIEHNAEHATELRSWAERIRAAGREEVAEELDLAAQELGWVNEALTAALEKLGGLA
jgi:predicted RNA-binding protein